MVFSRPNRPFQAMVGDVERVLDCLPTRGWPDLLWTGQRVCPCRGPLTGKVCTLLGACEEGLVWLPDGYPGEIAGEDWSAVVVKHSPILTQESVDVIPTVVRPGGVRGFEESVRSLGKKVRGLRGEVEKARGLASGTAELDCKLRSLTGQLVRLRAKEGEDAVTAELQGGWQAECSNIAVDMDGDISVLRLQPAGGSRVRKVLLSNGEGRRVQRALLRTEPPPPAAPPALRLPPVDLARGTPLGGQPEMTPARLEACEGLIGRLADTLRSLHPAPAAAAAEALRLVKESGVSVEVPDGDLSPMEVEHMLLMYRVRTARQRAALAELVSSRC
eukprot:Hpha_TRINITY_DN18629_c0_g1::TRINITY_DN18629_c0_g1_i1::g.115678::m.115678